MDNRIRKIIDDHIILFGECCRSNELDNEEIKINLTYITEWHIEGLNVTDAELIEIKKSNNIEDLKNTILKLSAKKLLDIKMFHLYVESYCKEIPLNQYEILYEEYKSRIDNELSTLREVLNKEIEDVKNYLLKKKESIENAEPYTMKKYNESYELAEIMENSLNEVTQYAGLFKDFDNTLLNEIDDIFRVVWVDSIRSKIKMDKITISFLNITNLNNKIYIQQNNKGNYFFKDLPLAIFTILNNKERRNNKSSFIISLYRVFKDIDFVKALCTTRYDDKSIMDLKTFNTHLERLILY